MIAASLTVHRVSDMTKKGRKQICQWLRQLAQNIEDHPEIFAKTFRAQYHYESKEKS